MLLFFTTIHTGEYDQLRNFYLASTVRERFAGNIVSTHMHVWEQQTDVNKCKHNQLQAISIPSVFKIHELTNSHHAVFWFNGIKAAVSECV